MSPSSRRPRRRRDYLAGFCLSLLAPLARGQEAPSLHRWGQAVAYIPSPPSILLHGGKTDSGNGFTYTSAPNSADSLILPLSSGFSASSSTSLVTVDAPGSPAYAWHTLTPFSTSDGKWDLLSFGGDAPSEAVQTGSHSAWYLTLDPRSHAGTWQRQAGGWGNQPPRRIYHSAVGHGGRVYITGGLRNDGSGNAHSETYMFDPANGFTTLAPLPRATYHHASVMLPNATLVVIGGVAIDMSTGMPATRPLNTIAVLDSSSSSGAWNELQVAGTAPQPRRGMASALSEDGKTLFIHGGATTTFGDAFSDAWTLDLDKLVWSRVGQGVSRRQSARQVVSDPGGRYDHSAVMAPGGQVVILGGYGGDSVADPGPYVFDLPEGTWSSEYTPAPASADPASASGTDISSPAATNLTESQSSPASTPVDSSASRPDSPSSPGESGSAITDRTDGSASNTVSGSNTAATPSSSSSQAPTTTVSGLGLPAQLGLIFGVLAVAAVIVALLVWRYRRRKRQERLKMSIYGFAPAQPPSRPYGSRNKGGEGLMEEARMADEKANPPIPGPSPPPKPIIGFGAIGASFASLRNYVQRPSDSYAALHDEGAALTAASPIRKSTRKVGHGIRLIGPRSPPSGRSMDELPRPRYSTTTVDSRRDMLSDEDSRNFPPGVDDWEVGDISRGRWKSAHSILASHAEDPFEDEDGEDGVSLQLPPVIRGGPVPTPHDSRTNLNPFDEPHTKDLSDMDRAEDFGLPQVHSDPLLDLGSLLPPPNSSTDKRFSGISMISGPSTAMTDREEGVIQQAQYAALGRAASIVSPAETSYVPIKRTDTFFRRMAAGGISSLLSPSSKSLARSQSSTTSLYEIRDPAPPPSLWPVVSRDMLKHRQDEAMGNGSTSGNVVYPSKPPTAWKGGNLTLDLNNLQRPTHHPGPSLTSITSAKSMRDMVIVQREPTSSSGESAVVEHTALESESGRDRLGSEEDADSSDEHTPRVKRGVAMSVPGSVVFDGADFAMSPMSMDGQSASTPDPNLAATTPPPATAAALPRSTPSQNVVTPPRSRSRPTSQIPAGSPIPHPLLSHRRPVSEMVNSINKRGAGAGASPSVGSDSPRSLFSPASQYTPAPRSPARSGSGSARASGTSTPPRGGPKRPSTLYEAVKRDKLLIANPDGARK